MKLTVIIPVYRTEATLDRCVESVLRQDVSDMEVILIDDGSPDGSRQKCDRWAAEDRRIRVIHQQNGGLSAARNAGIEMATGESLTFVDSDDWVEQGTYGALLTMLDDADIVEYSVRKDVGGRELSNAHGAAQEDCLQLEDRRYTDMNRYWLQTKAYCHTYAWNKLYRRALFEEVRYPVGKVFEDVYTLPKLLRKARCVRTTGHGCYHYTQNPEGICATSGGQGLAQLLNAHLTSGMPMDDSYYMHLVNIQIDVRNLTGAPISLPRRHVNPRRLTGKAKLKAIAVNTIGIKMLCRIIKLLSPYCQSNR